MNEPEWKLDYLKPVSPAFLEFYSMYEKMVKDACRKPSLNFEIQPGSSYSLAQMQQEMTEKRIEQFLTATFTGH